MSHNNNRCELLKRRKLLHGLKHSPLRALLWFVIVCIVCHCLHFFDVSSSSYCLPHMQKSSHEWWVGHQWLHDYHWALRQSKVGCCRYVFSDAWVLPHCGRQMMRWISPSCCCLSPDWESSREMKNHHQEYTFGHPMTRWKQHNLQKVA